jgi:hypothetical protein
MSVFADFNNSDRLGRIRLNTRGTHDDLQAQSIELYDGMPLVLDDREELTASAIVRWDDQEGWVAELDWSTIYSQPDQS